MDSRTGDGTSTAPMTLTMAKRIAVSTAVPTGKCLVAHLERAEKIEAAARGVLPVLLDSDRGSVAAALEAEVRPWR